MQRFAVMIDIAINLAVKKMEIDPVKKSHSVRNHIFTKVMTMNSRILQQFDGISFYIKSSP